MVLPEKKNITKIEQLLQAAIDAGLDITPFEYDYEHKAKQLFEEDLRMAKDLGVRVFQPFILLMKKITALRFMEASHTRFMSRPC